eukprot:scaffold36683_cov57-Phaeocystis_antarctica.AAC.5
MLSATTTLTLRRLPRLSLRLTTRPLASQAAGPSGVGPACFGSGLAGGMMGGLIGLGGGVLSLHVRPGASVLYVRATRTSLQRSVRT